MDVMDILIETQTQFVTEPDMGANVSISYTHKSGLVIPALRCFVGDGVFSNDKNNRLENTTTFSSLILSEKPTVDDTIIYGSENYSVYDPKPHNGMWAVLAKKSRHRGK